MYLSFFNEMELQMTNHNRQEQILQLLNAKGELQVSELASLFNVNPITIRRDLDILESTGKLTRSRGKAILNQSDIMHEKPFDSRIKTNAEQKIKIARLAHSFIRQGEHIFVGSGSTLYYFSKTIDNSKRLWIITDAINSAAELSSRNNVSVFVIGGELTNHTLTTTGSYAESMIQDLQFDTAYIYSTSIDCNGFFYHRSFAEHSIYKHLPQQSKQLVLLADSSKLGQKSFVKVGQLRAGDILITDNGISPQQIKKYEDLGISVKIAE